MNANQRRKARRRGEYTKADLVYADRLAHSLYKLDLSHTNSMNGMYSYRISHLSNAISAGYTSWGTTAGTPIQGIALTVEDMDAVLKSVTFP